MDTLLTFELLQDLEWGPELLLIVTLTFLGRFTAMRLLKVLAKHFAKTTNVWDDALLEAARRPLSWLILSFGLLLAIGISDGYVYQTLFSANNQKPFSLVDVLKLPYSYSVLNIKLFLR